MTEVVPAGRREDFSPERRDQAEAGFLAAHPRFGETALVDELRATDYARLDESGDVYLDYTGGSLYAASQLDEHMRMMGDKDQQKAGRVVQAMLKMKKLDIAGLQKAYDGK